MSGDDDVIEEVDGPFTDDGYVDVIEKSAYDRVCAERDEWMSGAGESEASAQEIDAENDRLRAELAEKDALISAYREALEQIRDNPNTGIYHDGSSEAIAHQALQSTANLVDNQVDA